MAYAWCLDDALCPEDLGPYWEYWGFNSGEWIADPDATVTCLPKGKNQTEMKHMLGQHEAQSLA